eukprot:272864_1
MSLLPTVVVVFFSFFTFSFSSTINPSVSNSSGDYYISSKTTLASQAITCSSSNCHIICDTTCQNIAISASQSSSLTIDCLNVASCKKAQLKSGPTDTLTINCLAENACANAIFQFNSTSNADITCSHNATFEQVNLHGGTIGSCASSHFYGQQSNEVSVDCNGFDCFESVFHVNNSQTAEFRMHTPSFLSYTKVGIYTKTTIFGGHITNALIVKCLHSNSCQENKIYCPQDAHCDLHCKDYRSCAQNVYISDNDYNHFYVNISDTSNALYSTQIHCLDSNDGDISSYSTMTYRNDAQEWGCDDYTPHCCPTFHTVGETVNSCKSGAHCIQYCAPCRTDVIAANDSALTLMCKSDDYGDNPCEGKKVLCHGSTCEIECDAVNACKDMKVYIQDGDALKISCTQDLSCVGLQIWPRQFETPYINSVSLSCEMSQSCANVTVGYGIIAGTLDVQCTGQRSCEGMQFLEHDKVSYNGMMIENASTINCGASSACRNLSAHLVSHANAQNRIICNNTAVSSNGTGACYQSVFELYGISQHVGDWNVSCNIFDCQRIMVRSSSALPREPINLLHMECDAPYACASSSIYADWSNELHLECMEKGACFHSMVRGPSHAAKATQIVCSEADNSCASMTIDSRWKFMEDYVSLSCPSGKEYKSSCDKITFECDINDTPYEVTDIHHQETCYLHYDDHTFTYDACATVADGTYPVYGEKYCCPLIMDDANTIITSTEVVDHETTATRIATSTENADHGTTETDIVKSTAVVDHQTTVVSHLNTIILRSTAAIDSDPQKHNHKSHSITITVAVVFGCILVVAVVMYLIWCSFSSKHNKKRVDLSALLADDINDHSDERGVTVVVDDEHDRSSYAPPTTASTTELTAQ